VDDEDLRLLIDPWLHQYDDIHSGETLPEEEQYFETLIYGVDGGWLDDDDIDAEASFQLRFSYEDLGQEEYLDVLEATISQFEEEYGGEIGFLGYPDLEKYC